MKDHDTWLRRVHFWEYRGTRLSQRFSHDSLSILSDYRPSAPDRVSLRLRDNYEDTWSRFGDRVVRQCQSNHASCFLKTSRSAFAVIQPYVTRGQSDRHDIVL